MKKLTIQDIPLLQKYIHLSDYNEYNSNTITMLMWNHTYEVYYDIFDDFALVYTLEKNQPMKWLMPYCTKENRKKAIEMIRMISFQQNIPFEIHSMTKEFKDWLMDTYPLRFFVWESKNASDYIYDRFQQQSLSGKKMQKRRNHFHAFMKQYGDSFVFKKLSKDDIENIYVFLDEWKNEKNEDELETIDSERIGIELLLDHLDELPIDGGCIYIDGKLEAFSIVSKLSKDTIQIHVEKANKHIRGLYIAILKLYLETLDDDILYINREDDMGKVALRKAKSDMHPIFKIKKYSAAHRQLQIQRASTYWLNEIKQLWLTQFDEETNESTNFYFANFYQSKDTWILSNGTHILSCLQLRKMPISIHGKKEDIYFIVGVLTHPDHVGCGYMRLLFEEIFKLYSDTNYFYLQAYNWDIYRSFGFKETYFQKRIKLDQNAYNDTDAIFSSIYTSADLLKIYKAYTNNKDGYRIRDEKYYDELFIPYHTSWDANIKVCRKNDIIIGYILYEENDVEIHIYECMYDDHEHVKDICALLSKEEKKVYIYSDIDSEIQGKSKIIPCMMVKCVRDELSSDHLFINETI